MQRLEYVVAVPQGQAPQAVLYLPASGQPSKFVEYRFEHRIIERHEPKPALGFNSGMRWHR